MYNSLADYLNKRFSIDAHYFIKGGFWLSLAQVIGIIFGIVTTALYAHYLTVENYGVYRYLVSLAALISAFSLTGIGQAILQASAKKYYAFYSETLLLTFLFSGGVFLCGCIAAIYYWLQSNNILAVGCLFIGLLQPLINTFQYTSSFLQGDGRFRESTAIQSIRVVTTSIGSAAVLFLTTDILTLFFAYLLLNAAVNVVTHFFYKPKQSTATPSDLLNKFISSAKHSSVRNILSSIAFRIDSVFIFTQLGAAELAFYSIAILVPEQIKGSFKNLANLLLPKYSSHINKQVVLKGVPKRTLQISFLLIVITILYIVIAPFIYDWLFPKYSSTVLYSQIYALAFPTFVTLVPLAVIQSRLDEKTLHAINNQNLFIGLFLVVPLTLLYGVMGAVVAKVLSRYFNAVYVYFKFSKLN